MSDGGDRLDQARRVAQALIGSERSGWLSSRRAVADGGTPVVRLPDDLERGAQLSQTSVVDVAVVDWRASSKSSGAQSRRVGVGRHKYLDRSLDDPYSRKT